MIITNFTYEPYSLKFKKPFLTSKGIIKSRKGFIIRIIDDTGKTFEGDCAPFEEFGTESLNDALKAVKNIKPELIEVEDLTSLLFYLKEFADKPALSFALEQALFSFITYRKSSDFFLVINRRGKKTINVNYAIGFNSIESTLDIIKQKINEGFSTFKLKVGRDDIKEDINLIKKVNSLFGDSIKIRLDANGKWNYKEALKFIKSISKFNIEYLEQPVNLLEDFIKLKLKTETPLAVDESLNDYDSAVNFINNKAADVFIIKPITLGGIIPSVKILTLAEKNNIKCTITTLFESAIGKRSAVFLASLIKEEHAHGLGTSDYFSKDIVKDNFPVVNGKITYQKAAQFSTLKE